MSTSYELKAVVGVGRAAKIAHSCDHRIEISAPLGCIVQLELEIACEVDADAIEVIGIDRPSNVEFANSTTSPRLWVAYLYILNESDLQTCSIRVGTSIEVVTVHRESWQEWFRRRLAHMPQQIRLWWSHGSSRSLVVQRVLFRPSGFAGNQWLPDPNGRPGLVIGTSGRVTASDAVYFNAWKSGDAATLDQPELWSGNTYYYRVKFLGVGWRQRQRCREAVRSREEIWDLNEILESTVNDSEKRSRAVAYLLAGMRDEVHFRRREHVLRSSIENMATVLLYIVSAICVLTLLARSPSLYGEELEHAVTIGAIGTLALPPIAYLSLLVLSRFWQFIRYCILVGLVGSSAFLLLANQGSVERMWHAVVIAFTAVTMVAVLALFAQPHLERLGGRFFVAPAVLEEVVGIRVLRAATFAHAYSKSLGHSGSLAKVRKPGVELVKRIEDAARTSEFLFRALARLAESDTTRMSVRRRGEKIATTLREHSALMLFPGDDHIGAAISLQNASDAIFRGAWGDLAVREPETARAKISKVARILPRLLIATGCGVAALYTPLLEYLAPGGQIATLRATLLVSGFFALLAPDAGKVRDAVIPTIRK